MRINKKSAIATTLAAALTAISFVGCGGNDPQSQIKEIYPEYQDDKAMWIGGWDPPINTLEDYKLAAEMGITHMFIDQSQAKKGTQAYLNQFEYCKQAGIKAIVGNDIALGNGTAESGDYTDYSTYPAVDMLNLWDEPRANNFDEVAKMVDKYNEIYEGKDMT